MRQLECRYAGLAAQNRPDLRADATRLVKVVVVPVQNHLAPRRKCSCRALLANSRAARQHKQPHHQPGGGVARHGRLSDGRVLLDELESRVLGAEQRLDRHDAIIHHERLERPVVVLVCDLAKREQRVFRPIAREHRNGGQGVILAPWHDRLASRLLMHDL